MSAAHAARPGPLLAALHLQDFRNHRSLALGLSDARFAIVGENGSGKTNILEALSLLAPGRGLRRAELTAMARHGGPGSFTVAVTLATALGPLRLGTAYEPERGGRRHRRDGAELPAASDFADHLRLLWLTPDQDSLFRGAAGERRRFLDRLVLAIDATHGARVAAYERALSQRNRLLEDPRPLATWLDGLEREIADLGVAIAAQRLETVDRLATLAAARHEPTSPFPLARLALAGAVEAHLRVATAAEAEAAFRAALAEARPRDRAAGRATVGPQTSDLVVHHAGKDMPAALCSTGEQKALLVGLLLAQAELVADMTGHRPILLLDEVTAHLDRPRRAALFQRLAAQDLQAVMTGTDASLFAEGPVAIHRLTP